MPEGDTVVRAAHRLDRALAGRELVRADLRIPRYATADLVGMAVLGTATLGKHLLTRLDSGLTLHSHLRMDGAWRTFPVGERWRGGPMHDARVILANDAWRAVGFRLHDVELVETRAESALVGHLGPDLLAADYDQQEAVRRFEQVPEVPIGEALLDQRLVAGIGNIYRMEICFLAGVSPWARIGDVDVPKVLTIARRLMLANVGRSRRVTTGDPRDARPHWVAEQAGRRCLRCGTTIRSSRQGPPGRERVTQWCPRCQPAPVGPNQ